MNLNKCEIETCEVFIESVIHALKDDKVTEEEAYDAVVLAARLMYGGEKNDRTTESV